PLEPGEHRTDISPTVVRGVGPLECLLRRGDVSNQDICQFFVIIDESSEWIENGVPRTAGPSVVEIAQQLLEGIASYLSRNRIRTTALLSPLMALMVAMALMVPLGDGIGSRASPLFLVRFKHRQ